MHFYANCKYINGTVMICRPMYGNSRTENMCAPYSSLILKPNKKL